MLIEWGEVRAAGELRTSASEATNSAKHHAESRRRQSTIPLRMPGGKQQHRTFDRIRLGRLIINTEIYPCAKRACVAIDAIRKSQIGQFQIRGSESKKHMKAYDEETSQG